MLGECPTMIGDGESARCYSAKIVRGRKAHSCCECDREIPKGVHHEYSKGVANGAWFSARTCVLCKRVRDSLFKGSFIHGCLWDELQYHYGNEGGWFDPPTEPIEG